MDHRTKPSFWIEHVDGLPLRKLADQNKISPAKAFRQVLRELNALPENTYVSAHFCNRFSGILNLDGKYVKVKGYPKKIPFIYSIDFPTHDIPIGILAPSENVQAFRKLFRLLRSINYPLKVIICDDSSALKIALKEAYPQAKIQLCHNHYFENLREHLKVRTDETYQPFFRDLKEALIPKYHTLKRETKLSHLNYSYGRKNDVLLSIMADLIKKDDELFTFQDFINCPNTNNLIESYNSHLNGRLKTIKGFNSFRSAERFCNAWMSRRRTKKFTDCTKPFKHLNGHSSIEKTLKKDLHWSSIFDVQKP